MSAETIRLRAEWVIPISGEPLRNGVVEITGDRITAVHNRPDPKARDFAGCAILPGLVNAHTHLEFSGLQNPLGPTASFTDWLGSVIKWRLQRQGSTVNAVRQGLSEMNGNGTALIGEIATQGWDAAAIPETGGGVVAFHEVLGLRPAAREEQLARARQFLTSTHAGGHVVPGLSPHAPYSVHPDLFRGLAAMAREFDAPLAMHLAETTAELELLHEGRGDFVPFLERLGVWEPTAIPRGTRILDYLRELEAVRRVLVVHGNFLDAEEQQFLSDRHNFTVVYCPRTHAYFGHPPHPWLRLQELGGRVALGTDSRASNPDLGIWDELRFLKVRFPAVPVSSLLRMATLDGAAALGQEHDFGSIAEGKRANLLVVKLTDTRHTNDPYVGLLDFPLRNHIVVHGGQWN